MNKIEIRIWNNYNFNKTAWIQIDNSNLENIWEYINRLKINKNRINAFYVRLSEDGFTYNIKYNIKNYKRFVNDLIKRFKKLEICCNILITDMEEEKEYKLEMNKPIFPLYISKIIFLSPLPEYEKDMGIKRIPISKKDMKYIENMKITIPKEIIERTQKLYFKYIIGKLKWLNFWIEKMEKKYNIKEKEK